MNPAIEGKKQILSDIKKIESNNSTLWYANIIIIIEWKMEWKSKHFKGERKQLNVCANNQQWSTSAIMNEEYFVCSKLKMKGMRLFKVWQDRYHCELLQSSFTWFSLKF